METGQPREELSRKFAEDILTRSKTLWAEKLQLPEIEIAGPLVKRSINLLIAQSGSGKSLCAFAVGWKETQNYSFSQMIYFDLDNPDSLVKERYAQFSPDRISYLNSLDIMQQFDYLQGLTVREKTKLALSLLAEAELPESLIVIDTLQQVADYNDIKELEKLFTLLRNLTFKGHTVLLLHHKSSKKESQPFKGLSYIFDSADVIYELTPDKDRSGLIRAMTLTNTKNRFASGFTRFVISIDTENPENIRYGENVLFEEELPVKEQILLVLKEHPGIKQQDVVSLVRPNVKLGEKKIRAVLTKLVALGIVTVKQAKAAKIYNLNTEMLEPGYWDALEEEFSEADLPF